MLRNVSRHPEGKNRYVFQDQTTQNSPTKAKENKGGEEGGRMGGRKGRKEGRKEGGREGGREGGKEGRRCCASHFETSSLY